MATCAYCKKQETQAYDDGVPICMACEEKLALREAPRTLDKKAAERRRIAGRAVELQRMGVSKPDIAQRLGVKYGQLRPAWWSSSECDLWPQVTYELLPDKDPRAGR